MTFRFRILAGIGAVVLALTMAYRVYLEGTVRTLTVAAGPADGEAFAIAEAIAEVTELYAPNLDVVILETSGSRQNNELLEGDIVDLALSQANVTPASTARLVATLYPDAFQLVARDGSGVERVADLRGRKVAVPPRGSGQHESFWFLMSHYGIDESDIEALPMSSESANWAMLSAAVDAVFRVRAPGNASIRELVRDNPSHLIPVDQAAAMRLRSPAIDAGIIPKGSYRGEPPLPEQDLLTAVVLRLLVADDQVPDEVVQDLTELLFQRRRELVIRTPLAGFIAAPDRAVGTFIPVHEGAQRYYDRDQPSYIQENAEPLALGLTLFVLLGSGLLQLTTSRRRRRIDRYNNDVLVLYSEARGTRDPAELHVYRERLMSILGRVVDDAEEGRITEEGFNFFSFTWRAVDQRFAELSGRIGQGPEGEPAEAPGTAPS